MKERLGNLSRRELLKLFGVSVGAGLAGQAAWPKKIQAQSNKVTPRKTARNVIFIQNAGAMSPPETMDLKETKYTAKDLDIVNMTPEWRISRTLFADYKNWLTEASVVRSMLGVPLVHFPAQYYTQAGRAMNPAIMREVPAFGSIVAYELDSQRRETDIFPTFMSFDLWGVRCPQIGCGMLPPKFAGLDLNTATIFDSFSGGGDSGLSSDVLQQRWEALNRVSEVAPVSDGELGSKAEEYRAHYDYGYKILSNPLFPKVLTLTDADKKRYGVDQDKMNNKLGLAMLLARNTLMADSGARFLWVANAASGGNGSFDNHNSLYGRGAQAPKGAQLAIYESAPRLERAVSALVQDLKAAPGKEAGKTLFDETLIVIGWEFGRTPIMNVSGGRDHHAANFPEIFMGGGVKPGRVVGRTDEYAAKVVETGWKYKQQPMMDHVAATIYSVLGIDYSKKIVDTPSGRAYEYQQTAPLGGPAFIPRTDIEELFI